MYAVIEWTRAWVNNQMDSIDLLIFEPAPSFVTARIEAYVCPNDGDVSWSPPPVRVAYWMYFGLRHPGLPSPSCSHGIEANYVISSRAGPGTFCSLVF